MKKALLFIGLAMCTSIAFAQTNNYAKVQKVKTGTEVQKLDLKALAMETADYKASIFTKAAGDTLGVFNFENTAAMAGILYAADGLVTANDIVNGVALTPNGSVAPCARWQWIEDTNYIESSSFAQTYSWLGGSWHSVCDYFKYYLGEDGGFMLMTLIDLQPAPSAGTQARLDELPHAYFQLPTVQKPDAGDHVIDLAFTQIYRKFYDQTYIDYKIGNSWKTREINVDGVDADINSYSDVYCRYVMPLELGNESAINLRFRYMGGTRSNAYGYFWGVDNVAIIAGADNRMLADAQDWAGGAYGTVPQGMELPLSWWAPVYNGGRYTITNASLHASHIASNDIVTEFATSSMPSLAAGDASIPTPYYFDEQGLLYTDSLSRDPYYFYYTAGAYTGGHYLDTVMDPELLYRGMPTNELGRNRVAVTATADSNITVAWDTIAYRVVGFNDAQPVAGYRWGHDNGIIAAGDSYHYGYTEDGQYITEDGNWNQNGYGVYLRYTTGPTIPTDLDGNPWVLRGVEIVTSPEHSALDLNGARLKPVTYIDYYDAEDVSISFLTLDNGVNEVSFTVDGSEAGNYMTTGVMVAEGEDYGAVNIFFPTQPELEPNTSYRLGYKLTSSCTFSAATTRSSYAAVPYTNSEGGTSYSYYSYDSNSYSAPWRRQFWPNYLDVLVADPVRSGLMISSFYHNSFPLIRAIVGPREVLPDAFVDVYCENQYEHYINYFGETVCATTITVPETSGPTFDVIPGGDHRVLDSLFIDDVYVTPNSFDDDGDDDFRVSDYDIIDTLDDGTVHTYLHREIWSYTFRNIQADTIHHSIRATSKEVEWTPVGIDPVAPEVRMYLAPNPATSQVSLDVRGVTGMVNCSIIDMSGRVVYNSQINAENTNTIDLRNVPAGAYFVRITNDTFSKVEKLIVR